MTARERQLVAAAILVGLVHGDEACSDRFTCAEPGHWHHPSCLDRETGERHHVKHCALVAEALTIVWRQTRVRHKNGMPLGGSRKPPKATQRLRATS